MTIDDHAKRFLKAEHERAMRDIKTQAAHLHQHADDAVRSGDGPGSPGNVSACATRLEAAREKAHALRQVLSVLEMEIPK